LWISYLNENTGILLKKLLGCTAAICKIFFMIAERAKERERVVLF
jgi:hypothetical protein